MDTLLPYYERELTFLRRLSHDFARRHPKVAGRLLISGETCEDPHIERLIESFAFLTGRIHKKLDDDFPEITDSLLQVIYPQYLRPFPSASIAHFNCANAAAQLTKASRIPRHTMLNTRPVRGLPCRFTTAYDVDIWPLRIDKASYENIFDATGLRSDLARAVSSVIRIDIAAISEQTTLDMLPLGKLRLFLNGEPSLVSMIREALFSKAVGLWISNPTSSEKIDLPLSAIQPVGFAADEALLEQDARSHRAYQLMLEYFAFPEKFNFIDIDLSALKEKLPKRTRNIELRIGLNLGVDNQSAANLLDRIGKENFVLGCTPVVNIFNQAPEPIRVTDMATSYPIIVDSRRPQAYEIYDIRRVYKVQKSNEGEEVNEFRPFYSLRHGEEHDGPARYWHAGYVDETVSGSYSMEISLVDSTLDPQRAETNTLSLDLVCTNRDLPAQLPFGLADGDLFIEGGSIAKTIHFLKKPTQSHRFPRGRGAQWRLISHLSLNHLSLSGTGVDAIKEILTLYDITRSIQNNRQVTGIVSIEQRPAMARIGGNPFPTFARGMEIRIKVDESHYAGIGLFMFAQILDHFFGLYVHTNSFTQLIIVSNQTGTGADHMPSTQRRVDPSLIDRLRDEPHRFEFFQAVRLLMNHYRKDAGAAQDLDILGQVIQFRSSVSLGFPPSEIESLQFEADQPDPAETAAENDHIDRRKNRRLRFRKVSITPSFIGLTGPMGVMPRHYTHYVAEREMYHRDKATRAFLDIFTTRAVALFYQTWLKHRLHLQFEADCKNRFLPMIMSLTGMGLSGTRGRLEGDAQGIADDTLAYYSSALRERPQSVQWFSRVIADYFQVQCKVEQFIGQWFQLPERELTRLGATNCALGKTAFCGGRIWDRNTKVRLTVGPMRKAQFDGFLPGSNAAQNLKQFFKLMVGATFDCEVRLILDKRDLSVASLGSTSGGTRLGWNGWMASRQRNTDFHDVAYLISAADPA